MAWGAMNIMGAELCLTYNGTTAIHFEAMSLRETDVEGLAQALNHMKAVPEPMAAKGTIRRECYELAEDENSNLRKLLAWAGYRLNTEDRRMLASLIRKDIKNGGIIEDGQDDDLREHRQIKVRCVKAAELLQEAAEKVPDNIGLNDWCSRASSLAYLLMEYDPPGQNNLATLRLEGKEEKNDRDR